MIGGGSGQLATLRFERHGRNATRPGSMLGPAFPTALALAFLTTLALAGVTALALASQARATIQPAIVLDGPANDIFDVDGAAMAADGSGGIVYRKQVGGVVHVFVAQLVEGRWRAAVEVDGEDSYGASQPAIAAGEGGRLLVAWVQPRNVSPSNVTEYELMSASLQPGASGFGQAIAIDTNVGERDTGDASAVDPKLAMAPDGAAYAVYRVALDDCRLGDETNPEAAKCRAGSNDEVMAVRAARFNYLTWSSMGEINRAPQLALRSPTPANAPSIGIDLAGNGVVVWQEPDASGAARIWARRLFGTVLGNVLRASPETLNGRSITSDADAPVVAVGPFGEARIAYRIDGAPGSAIAVTQLFVNSILSEVAPHGSQPQGPQPVLGASGSSLGLPSDAIDEHEEFRLAWTQGGAERELSGSSRSLGRAESVGASAGGSLTSIDSAGGGASAWLASVSGQNVVQAREDYAGGAFQAAQLAGQASGSASGLSLAGDGRGDALIGFEQGPPGRSEVLGSFVQAPPAPFVVNAPSGWLRASKASVSWEGAFDAVAGVRYAVYIDGRPALENIAGRQASLRTARLGDGVHRLQVLATDVNGQLTMSAAAALKIDADPPLVSVALLPGRTAVRVSIHDTASGVARSATRIAFGDGGRARRGNLFTHRYRHAGTYTIAATVADKVGNRARVHIRVRVR